MTPPRITAQAIDPKLQAVFDALDAYMAGTTWTNGNASITFDGGGITHSMNCSDRGGINSFTYTQRTAGDRVVITPNVSNLGPGETMQFTASAVDSGGEAIAGTFTWTLQAGALGTVDVTGLYSAPATIAAAGMDTVSASLDGQTAWTSVTIQLHV